MRAVSPSREFSLVFTMKRLGLSRHFCAATLFLAAGLRGADDARPAPAAPVAHGAVEQLREISPDVLDVSVVKPAAAGANDEALRREWLLRFDRNGDGRLDEGERATLRAEVMRPPGSPRKGLLEPDEAALLRRFFREEFRAAAAPARPETVAERLVRRRAESLRRAEQPKLADTK